MAIVRWPLACPMYSYRLVITPSPTTIFPISHLQANLKIYKSKSGLFGHYERQSYNELNERVTSWVMGFITTYKATHFVRGLNVVINPITHSLAFVKW